MPNRWVVTTPQKLLVIEDDPDTSRLFVEVLDEAGFAAYGCRPDELPERNGFAAVLTDLGVRNRSTSLAHEWLTLLAQRYAAPLIVVSGLRFVDQDGAFAGIAADVIRKPIDIDNLVRRVKRVLAQRA